MEALISTVVITLTVGAALTGLQTLSLASTGANADARIDATLSAYGEALKSTEYIECAESDDYQSIIDGLESGSSDGEKLTPASASSTMSVSILTIENNPPCPRPYFGPGSIDSGTQTITYRVTRTSGSATKARTAVVKKLNPDGAPGLPHAVIDTPVLDTTPGDVVASYSFTATASFGEKYPIVRYEWNCGGRNENPILGMDFGTVSPTPTSLAVERRGRDVTSPSDPTVHCVFPASSTGDTTYTMSLFVYDSKGQVSVEDVRTVTVARAAVSRLAPVAQAAATPATGTVPLTVSFSSAGSRSPDGDIASYSWDFKDPASGSVNNSTAANPSHTFYQPGVYDVTLTVTDDVGVQASDIAQVTVGSVAVPLPIARFTAPSPLVAPTRATFDASSSTTGNGQPVASYSWTFGDGGTATGAVVTHDFSNAGTFQVALQVEDSAGRVAVVTQNIDVLPFVAPTDFRVVAVRSYIPCLFFGCPGARTGYFDFGWTNRAASPGDTVSYEINVTALQGCIAWASQTRTYNANASDTWQVVHWEEPTTNPFDVTTQICAGSVYNYKMRVKRVNSLGTLYSPWSPTQRVTA
jgi:PKD repeat protein